MEGEISGSTTATGALSPKGPRNIRLKVCRSINSIIATYCRNCMDIVGENSRIATATEELFFPRTQKTFAKRSSDQ